MERRSAMRSSRATPSAPPVPNRRWSSMLSALREPVVPTVLTEHDLHDAIDHHEMTVHFQLVVDGDGAPAGAEALLRWNRPGHGIVGAAGFMDAVVSLDLARRLGDVVMGEVVAALPTLRAIGVVDRPYVGLNASPTQLQDRMFAGRLSAHLRSEGTEGTGLVVELTDPTAVTDWPAVTETIAELARIGIDLAVDDTGSEPGDLLYRDRCEARFVKLDRSLIAESRRWARERRLVEATIRLCADAGHPVIAQGIEDAATMDWLCGQGVAYLQGFHVGRPEPIGELAARLQGGPAPRQATGRATTPAVGIERRAADASITSRNG